MKRGYSQQDQDLQCGATVKGTSGKVAQRLINLKAARNQLAQQVSQIPFCVYITVEYDSAPFLCPGQEADSAFSTLRLQAVWSFVSRAGLSILNTESLSCVEPCVKSRTQHSLC